VNIKITITTSSNMVAGIPVEKNSPVLNCLDSYAMALGAAPMRSRKGMPAAAVAMYRINCGFTPRY